MPNIKMAEELHPLFQQGRVTHTVPSLYTVELDLNPTYQRRLSGEEAQLQIGYQFIGERTALSGGVVPVRVQAVDSSVTLSIQNPDRISAKEIQLYLAH